MITNQIFIVITIAVLAIVALLVFLFGGKKQQNRLTPLAGLAFAFVLAGILFGESRLIGYGLLGVGVILAIIDIVTRSKGR